MHVDVACALPGGSGDNRVFVRARNLGDAKAFNASSISTVRALAPLPGRSLMVGLRVGW